MNLNDYRASKPTGQGDFIKWKENGEVKVLRFLYTSHDGADIEVRRKKWDDVQKKYVYDTDDGTLFCVLNAVLYEKGKDPVKVRWDRSASFTEQACNGYWAKFPRIIDGVWEVTCTNPGTKDIKFSWFPVMGADFTTYPLPEGVRIENGQVVYEDKKVDEDSAQPEPVPQSAPRKYWE